LLPKGKKFRSSLAEVRHHQAMTPPSTYDGSAHPGAANEGTTYNTALDDPSPLISTKGYLQILI
jgi:hypothetical protein